MVAEERKFTAHSSACQAVGISFIPLAIESLGGLGDTTSDTISSIGHLLGQRLSNSTSKSRGVSRGGCFGCSSTPLNNRIHSFVSVREEFIIIIIIMIDKHTSIGANKTNTKRK